VRIVPYRVLYHNRVREVLMCKCNLIDAEISKDGIQFTCDCGDAQVDAETLKALEVVVEWLRR
jgi:hypothetical protein